MTTTTEMAPAVCTLSPGAYRDRMAWIRELAARSLRDHRRYGLMLRLTYDPEAAHRVRELVSGSGNAAASCPSIWSRTPTPSACARPSRGSSPWCSAGEGRRPGPQPFARCPDGCRRPAGLRRRHKAWRTANPGRKQKVRSPAHHRAKRSFGP
jgi:hypothetical protein